MNNLERLLVGCMALLFLATYIILAYSQGLITTTLPLALSLVAILLYILAYLPSRAQRWLLGQRTGDRPEQRPIAVPEQKKTIKKPVQRAPIIYREPEPPAPLEIEEDVLLQQKSDIKAKKKAIPPFEILAYEQIQAQCKSCKHYDECVLSEKDGHCEAVPEEGGEPICRRFPDNALLLYEEGHLSYLLQDSPGTCKFFAAAEQSPPIKTRSQEGSN